MSFWGHLAHLLTALAASAFLVVGSVLSGKDAPLDTWGGTLTEVGQSNMPAGGSPSNLNVEFIPGLVRTRGGLQEQTSYSAIAGGPWQVRWVDDYAVTPENPSQLVLLVNPTLNAQGVVADNFDTVIGSVYGYAGQQQWSPYSTDTNFAGPLAKGCAQFGRKYIAISDGRYGYDLPRQWDGTNYDRVSQCGPGQAPSVADSTATQSITAIQQYTNTVDMFQPFAFGESTNQYLVTATPRNQSGVPGQNFTALAQPGDQVIVSGAGVGNYNGTWTLLTVIQPSDPKLPVQWQFAIATTGNAATSGNIASSLTAVTVGTQLSTAAGNPMKISGFTAGAAGYNGTWTVRYVFQGSLEAYIGVATAGLPTNPTGGGLLAGSISAGLHQLSVCFITRQGYITKPAPPTSWYAGGGLQAAVTNIPTGPSNIIARLLIATPVLEPPATTGTFYSVRRTNTTTSTVMQINDNTSTTATINFSDSDLTSGFNAQYLFSLVELGECAGCFPFAGRMFWWGELNSLQGFYNMEFGGGWNLNVSGGGFDVPLGWTQDATYGPGGNRVLNGGVWGDAYKITGAGSAGPVGMITQAAFQNYLGTPLLNALTRYGIRITAKQANPGPNGELWLDVYDPGTTTVLAASGIGGWTGTYTTQIRDLSLALPAVVPADAVVRLYGSNMATGGTFTIDRAEIFPTAQPINYTTLRASYPSDPESFDGVTGLIQPVYSNGQAVRAAYTVRDSLYVACDRSKFVTKNTPGSEPALWTVDPVSAAVGTTGASAVAAGEDWEVFINRYGLYIYIGREPQKISQEIQSLWNKSGYSNLINWAYGHKVWATVDLLDKRAYIGAPVGGAAECNTVFVMDYNTLDTSEMIAQYPTLRFSPYTGRRVILEQGRKWTMWQFQTPAGTVMPVPCGSFVEQPGMVAEFLLGGAADNNVYFIDPTNRGNDNGQFVKSYYTTFFTPNQEQEQVLELRSHRHLLSYLASWATGTGLLNLTAYSDTLANPPQQLPPLNLSATPPEMKDFEDPVDIRGERIAFQFGANTLAGQSQLGAWWQMERLCPTIEDDPQAIVSAGA